MKVGAEPAGAFTLVEMLVVIAVIAIIAALLLPVLSGAKSRASRTACLNNLRQINVGVRMYSDDANDTLPSGRGTNGIINYYKPLVLGYVGLNGSPSPQDKLFACPADTFHYAQTNWVKFFVPRGRHEQAGSYYSSYAFNGINAVVRNLSDITVNGSYPGISGWKLSSVKHPAKTVLVTEHAAFFPYSWHQPKQPVSDGANCFFNNARDMLGFVDGHVSYIKIYWNGQAGYYAAFYDPPAGYDYQWSGN